MKDCGGHWGYWGTVCTVCVTRGWGVCGGPRELVGSGWMCLGALCLRRAYSCREDPAPDGRCWLCGGYGRLGQGWGALGAGNQCRTSRSADAARRCGTLVRAGPGRSCAPSSAATSLHINYTVLACVFPSCRLCVVLQIGGRGPGEGPGLPLPPALSPSPGSSFLSFVSPPCRFLTTPLLPTHRPWISTEPSVPGHRLPPLPLPREEPGCWRPVCVCGGVAHQLVHVALLVSVLQY